LPLEDDDFAVKFNLLWTYNPGRGGRQEWRGYLLIVATSREGEGGSGSLASYPLHFFPRPTYLPIPPFFSKVWCRQFLRFHKMKFHEISYLDKPFPHSILEDELSVYVHHLRRWSPSRYLLVTLTSTHRKFVHWSKINLSLEYWTIWTVEGRQNFISMKWTCVFRIQPLRFQTSSFVFVAHMNAYQNIFQPEVPFGPPIS